MSLYAVLLHVSYAQLASLATPWFLSDGATYTAPGLSVIKIYTLMDGDISPDGAAAGRSTLEWNAITIVRTGAFEVVGKDLKSM